MSDITVTAEKTNKAVLMRMTLTTETRDDPNDATKEQYRAIFRVVTQQEAFNVADATSPKSSITKSQSLTVRFNQTDTITLDALSDFEPFMLIGQDCNPHDAKGSRMFSGIKEWTSVSAWTGLEWSNE